MLPPIETIFLLLAIGGAVGIVSGSLGIGGGILMVPVFLEFISGMDQKTAIGTSLGVIVGIATINAWRLNIERGPDWPLILGVATSAICFAYLSARLASSAPDRLLKAIFALLAMGLAIRTFLLKPQANGGARNENGADGAEQGAAQNEAPTEVQVEVEVQGEVHGGRPDLERRDDSGHERGAGLSTRGFYLKALGTGIAMGSASGVTGIGGGGIFVPLALWLRLAENKRVVAASNAIMVVVAAAGLLAYLGAPQTANLEGLVWGQFHPQTALFAFIGAIPASILGRRINKHLTIQRRKLIMGSLLLIIAVRMILRAL